MKNKRKALSLISLIVVATMLFTLAGCKSKKAMASGGNFIFGITTEPAHLNPYLDNSADTREILFNIFEGLVKPDKDGNLVLAVAQSYKISTDALSYTFKIRSGIRFQNGKKVTADDVKYSLDTAAGINGSKTYVTGLDNIKAVNVADANTVTVELKKSDPDFLPNLTVAIVPKDYNQQETHPIGTGPYSFKSFSPQQSLVLVKNQYYWKKGLPHLDRVTFKLEASISALLMDLKAGSVDGASVDNATARQIGNGYNIIKTNSNSVQQLDLNNAVKPFDNVKVRQAISYAVDPDEIIKTVNYGAGVRVGTPVIPGLKKYCDTDLKYAYKKDTAKAKELLQQAGYSNGFKFTITVPSNYQVHVDTAQVIVNELKAIGVTADIKQVDFATWLSQVYTNRQYEATIVSVDGSTVSPKSYLDRYASTSPKDFVNYKSSEFDALYEKLKTEINVDSRDAIYKQAQEILSHDAASVYIQDIASLVALKKGYTGFTAYPLYVLDAAQIYKK